MKSILSFLVLAALWPMKAMANPACVVCTVAIGASLEVARKLGVGDAVVGLWIGAVLALLGYWAILWFDRKGWNFYGRDFLLMALSLSTVGFLYAGQLAYTPKVIGFFYMDGFLFSVLAGAAVYVCSQKLYARMKARNNNHAHFPFEKVVLPLAMLAVGSLLLNYSQL